MAISFLFSFCLSLLFISWLFVRPPQTTILPFYISFSCGWSWSLPLVQFPEPPSIVHQALCLSHLIHWIYLSLPLYNRKRFDLGHTCSYIQVNYALVNFTCLLRNLYVGQESPVTTGHGTTEKFKIRKGVCQGWILSPCLFNLHAEYIMRNAGVDEAQAGIKTARRNINNLRYADNITLMSESKKELKSLSMRVKKESEKPGLQLKSQKTKIMASGPITSWQIDIKAMEMWHNYFLRLQNHCRWWLQS